MISVEKLKVFGAEEKHYDKSEDIFKIGQVPRFYLQVLSGKVKMNNFNDDGREFIQGIFQPGESFGEPPLFGDFEYPAGAQAIEKSVVLALGKKAFFEMLKQHPEITLSFTKTLAKRLHYKATIAAEISTQDSSHRILTLLDYFKEHNHLLDANELYVVELTRQQIADLTGLRVETVIRSIKKLEQLGEIKIVDRKVLR